MAQRMNPISNIYPGEPLLPQHASPSNNEAGLEEKARQVGYAVGKAVVTLRRAGETLKDVAGETRNTANEKAQQARSRITEMAGTIREKSAQWGDAASGGIHDLRQAATEKAGILQSQVKTGYYRMRLRANRTVREYPMQLVLIAGAAGFLLGVGLRIWRATREY